MLCLSAPASAWTRAGHMVTAAIAYDDLAAKNPKIVDAIVALMDNHPDRGAFQVAIGRTTGEARAQRVFLEMARWPDDIRGGSYDHPTWHYALAPVVDAQHGPPAPPPDGVEGEAYEAYALNLREAADERAPPADRAVALCWIFHLVGDIHQPLHNAQLFSAHFPGGDKGGAQQFVRDPESGEPITLHWFWDDSVSRSDDPEAAMARGRELESAFPRSALGELQPGHASAADFVRWAQTESHALAVTDAYTAGLATGDSAATAKALPPSYIANAKRVAARRVALAGYRLADALRAIFAGP
jgi:hypothetical protein